MPELDVTCVCVSYDTAKHPPRGFPSCLNHGMQCNADSCLSEGEGRRRESVWVGWGRAALCSVCPHSCHAAAQLWRDVPICLPCPGGEHMELEQGVSRLWLGCIAAAATVQKAEAIMGKRKKCKLRDIMEHGWYHGEMISAWDFPTVSFCTSQRFQFQCNFSLLREGKGNVVNFPN